MTTTFKVQGGAYNGLTATAVSGIGETNHIYVVGKTTITAVAGDVSVDELTKVLSSAQQAK